MLIEFTVGNYKSFGKMQTLTLAASASAEFRETHIIHVPGSPDLLRAAAIYGPNAAGKSNLIDALKFVKNFVCNSNKIEEKKATAVPFLLNLPQREEVTL